MFEEERSGERWDKPYASQGNKNKLLKLQFIHIRYYQEWDLKIYTTWKIFA